MADLDEDQLAWLASPGDEAGVSPVDPNDPNAMATVTVIGHPTDWNTVLWWAVVIGVGYYLMKEAKLT